MIKFVDKLNKKLRVSGVLEDGYIAFYDEDVQKIMDMFNLDTIYINFAHNKDVPFQSGRPDTYEVVDDRNSLTPDRFMLGYLHENDLTVSSNLNLATQGFVALYCALFPEELEEIDEWKFIFDGVQYNFSKHVKKFQDLLKAGA